MVEPLRSTLGFVATNFSYNSNLSAATLGAALPMESSSPVRANPRRSESGPQFWHELLKLQLRDPAEERS